MVHGIMTQRAFTVPRRVFNMRYSASGMWGQGNYFAVNASYSDGYAHTDSSGHSQMFLAKVLTGDSYACSPDRNLRMPPEKSSYAGAASNVHLEQMRYDTVTGTTSGYTVYMTYDNLKAYPAYLITYQCRSYRRLGIFLNLNTACVVVCLTVSIILCCV